MNNKCFCGKQLIDCQISANYIYYQTCSNHDNFLIHKNRNVIFIVSKELYVVFRDNLAIIMQGAFFNDYKYLYKEILQIQYTKKITTKLYFHWCKRLVSMQLLI